MENTISALTISRTRIAILLATYNGVRWIEVQLQSLLSQKDVDVVIFISDDFSTDGTYDFLKEKAMREPRLILLPRGARQGSAGRNFYRLLHDVDFQDFDYIAFSDQDDVWDEDKLARHVQLARWHNADGISSDVEAFWPDGRRVYIHKSQPLLKYDYLFESAGPGCSFLISRRLAHQLKTCIANPSMHVVEVSLHDWLTYAIARASGYRWVIDTRISLRYRQHDENVLGANSGILAWHARLKKLMNGWYRAEILKISKICALLSDNPDYKKIIHALSANSWWQRMQMFPILLESRRSRSARLVFIILFICGVF